MLKLNLDLRTNNVVFSWSSNLVTLILRVYMLTVRVYVWGMWGDVVGPDSPMFMNSFFHMKLVYEGKACLTMMRRRGMQFLVASLFSSVHDIKSCFLATNKSPTLFFIFQFSRNIDFFFFLSFPSWHLIY